LVIQLDDQDARTKLVRYIRNTERVFMEMAISPPSDPSLYSKFEYNLSLAKQYFQDSKYYLERGDFITALVCVAYCEGLLDACRNLGWLNYEWSVEV